MAKRVPWLCPKRPRFRCRTFLVTRFTRSLPRASPSTEPRSSSSASSFSPSTSASAAAAAAAAPTTSPTARRRRKRRQKPSKTVVAAFRVVVVVARKMKTRQREKNCNFRIREIAEEHLLVDRDENCVYRVSQKTLHFRIPDFSLDFKLELIILDHID